MARTDSLGNFLTDVADAIREKTGSEEAIQASEFDTAISEIPSGLDWSAIGYSDTPQSIVDGYNYAKYIQENWNDGTSRLTNNFKNVVICPMVSLGNRTSILSFADGCRRLIEIPLLDTSNVTSTSNMFANCSSLTTIPLLNTSNVTNMSNMFVGCSSLTTMPLLNTSNVTTMDSMFNRCSSLTTIPLLNTSNVTNMSNMFNSCTNLTTIPLLDTSNVTSMSAMFNSCNNLTTIPLLGTSNVTNMLNMFVSCTSLTDTSLDNILQMCINATAYSGTKTLKALGITNTTYYPTSRIEALPHYQDFINAGWTIGY